MKKLDEFISKLNIPTDIFTTCASLADALHTSYNMIDQYRKFDGSVNTFEALSDQLRNTVDSVKMNKSLDTFVESVHLFNCW